MRKRCEWLCHLKGSGRAGVGEATGNVGEVPLDIKSSERVEGCGWPLAGTWLPACGRVSRVVLSVRGVGGGNDCKLSDTGVLTPASISGVSFATLAVRGTEGLISALAVLATGTFFGALSVLGTAGHLFSVAALLGAAGVSAGVTDAALDNFAGVPLALGTSALCVLMTLTILCGPLTVLVDVAFFFFNDLTVLFFLVFLIRFSLSVEGTPFIKPLACALTRTSWAASLGSPAWNTGVNFNIFHEIFSQDMNSLAVCVKHFGQALNA